MLVVIGVLHLLVPLFTLTMSLLLYVNIAPSVQPKFVPLPPHDDSRSSNVILFGLPGGKSIFESKHVVDEVFEFLAG